MSFLARESAWDGARLTVVEPGRPPSDPASPALTARAAGVSHVEPFAVEVQRREHVAVVQPRGELDLATIDELEAAVDGAITETLGAAVDGMEGHARVVLDLRGLSFIGSTGLHLLVALHRRSQSDGFQLTLLAPAAPVDKAIKLCGLDQALPFAAADDAVDAEAASWSGLSSSP